MACCVSIILYIRVNDTLQKLKMRCRLGFLGLKQYSVSTSVGVCFVCPSSSTQPVENSERPQM